jgi:hypothetical protein
MRLLGLALAGLIATAVPAFADDACPEGASTVEAFQKEVTDVNAPNGVTVVFKVYLGEQSKAAIDILADSPLGLPRSVKREDVDGLMVILATGTNKKTGLDTKGTIALQLLNADACALPRAFSGFIPASMLLPIIAALPVES